jgi:hypothetical protein
MEPKSRAASSYARIQCAIELRDADLRKDVASIQSIYDIKGNAIL